MEKQETPAWESKVLLFSGVFFLGSFIKYVFDYNAKWIDTLLAIVSPIGVLGLGIIFVVKGFHALLRKRLPWRDGEFRGGKAQIAGIILLFASGIFFWLGIRTLMWFVNHFSISVY